MSSSNHCAAKAASNLKWALSKLITSLRRPACLDAEAFQESGMLYRVIFWSRTKSQCLPELLSQSVASEVSRLIARAGALGCTLAQAIHERLNWGR